MKYIAQLGSKGPVDGIFIVFNFGFFSDRGDSLASGGGAISKAQYLPQRAAALLSGGVGEPELAPVAWRPRHVVRRRFLLLRALSVFFSRNLTFYEKLSSTRLQRPC